MAFFKDLLGKLGFKPKATTPATPVVKTTGNVRPVTGNVRPVAGAVGKAGIVAQQLKAAPMEMVDVVAKLDKLAAANSQKLNWKTSIVDLLKLLDIDSSLTSRKELATELGCPAAKMADSAEMNIWLHKAVLRNISENGGNVPASLLD
jgi:hypothetical protein